MTKRRRRKVNPGNPKRAVAYVRVSTEEQRLGPEAQRREIEQWAEREGVQIVAWCVDQGVSGATPIDQRKGLVEALGQLELHRAGMLVAQKRDRLARDVAVAAMLQRTVCEMGATVMTVAEAFLDLESPEGQFIATIFDAFGQLERARISARTRAALAAKRAKGQKLGGEAPFGYRAAHGGQLEQHPTEYPIIQRILELRRDGLSQARIAARLATEGVVSRSGQPLGQVQVSRILRAHEAAS